jgi:hypothetical protein
MNRDKSNNCDVHIRIINTLRNEQYFVKEMAVQYTSIVENMQHSVSNSENSYLFMRQKIQFTRRTINHLIFFIINQNENPFNRPKIDSDKEYDSDSNNSAFYNSLRGGIPLQDVSDSDSVVLLLM